MIEAVQSNAPPSSAEADAAADEVPGFLKASRGLVRNVLATAGTEAAIARLAVGRLLALCLLAVSVTTAGLIAAGSAAALALHGAGIHPAAAAALVSLGFAIAMIWISRALRRHAGLLTFPASRALFSALGEPPDEADGR